MTDSDTVSADYTLRPSELAATLSLLVEARQPTILWGAPGCAKSALAQQTAAGAARRYVDVRALLLDPVDLRGIPWRDEDGRTRWAPPAFLPPAGDQGRWLINLEELPSAVPMVQAALYQLVLDRKVGEYELPEGASLIACGNRESDRGVVHRMPTPLASRFVHLEIRVDAEDWLAWGAAAGIAPEVLFYIQMRPDLLHAFDPEAREKAFCCPRTWEIVSNVVNQRGNLDPAVERALFRGTVGEAAAVEFSAFLKVWRELPHPRAVLDDPENAIVPDNASALIALCGSLYRMADDITLASIVTYAQRLRREVGEFLVGSGTGEVMDAPAAGGGEGDSSAPSPPRTSARPRPIRRPMPRSRPPSPPSGCWRTWSSARIPDRGSLPRPTSRGDRLRIRTASSASPWSPAGAASRPCRNWPRTASSTPTIRCPARSAPATSNPARSRWRRTSSASPCTRRTR